MIDLIRRSRGLAIALVVLALSATAAFAAAPHGSPSASDEHGPKASESAEPSESEAPEPSDSAEPSDSESPDASGAAPQADATDSGQQGDHGALVSTAAQMPTPAGFSNHGAFVSCVAHLDATLATIDWTTVTPESCGQTTQSGAAPTTNGHGHGHGHGHGRPSWAGKPGS